MEEKIYCADCGRLCVPDKVSPGYGIWENDKKVCFECCARRDRENLMKLEPGEKYVLYLVENNGAWFVSNWPGTFKITVHPRTGRHNMAGVRRSVWFMLGGHNFYGVQYGNMSDILRVKRIK